MPTRWRPGTGSSRWGVHHQDGRTRRRTAPPGSYTGPSLSDAGDTCISGTPLPCPPSAHPGAAVHPPCQPGEAVTAYTRALHGLSMCYAWGLGKVEHTITRPALHVTRPRAMAPPPAQRRRAPPLWRATPEAGITYYSVQRDRTAPGTGGGPEHGSPTQPGHPGRPPRLPPRCPPTHRVPQCSLTARYGVSPGAHATCQREPGTGTTRLLYGPVHASNPGSHARTRHPPPEGGGSDGRVGRPLSHACSVHLSDCPHCSPRPTVPPSRGRCSTLRHRPLTSAEGSALSRWRLASPTLLPVLRRCTHTFHRDTGEGRTHAHNGGPCRRRTTVPRPSPAPPCSATDRQPQRPEGGPTRPRDPRTTRWRRVHLDCTAPSRGHGALRGEALGATGRTRLPGEHLLPRPGEAGSGWHRMQCLCTWPAPSSAGAPPCAPLPAGGHRPCLTATPPSRTARTGGQGMRVPAPTPEGSYVLYVYPSRMSPSN